MAAPSARLTRTEAVSNILVTAGLMPVSSESSPNAQVAGHKLDEWWRKMLSSGWWFNTRREFQLDTAADDTVTIPGEVIDLDTHGESDQTDDLIIVDGKLYSKAENSDKFTGVDQVAVDVILAVDFETAPLVAQEYAVALAAADFVRGRMGDARKARTIQENDVALARQELMRVHLNNSDFNLLGNPALSMQRRQPRTGLHAR